MAIPVKVSRTDLTHEADFVEPAFHIFLDPVNLIRRLYAKLSPHGVRFTDIRWDQGSGSVGDVNLLCSLFSAAATLRIRLEKVEVQCPDVSRVNVQHLTAVAIETLSLLESEFGVKFKTHSLSMSFHGFLENTNSRDFIAKFAFRGPENLGPSAGNGIVFYYGAHEKRLSAAVTFDLSVVVKDGLFIRVVSIWDAQKVPTKELTAVAGDYLRTALTSFGLGWQ